LAKLDALVKDLESFGLDHNKIERVLTALKKIYAAQAIGYFGGIPIDIEEYGAEVGILVKLGLASRGGVVEGRSAFTCTVEGDEMASALLKEHVAKNEKKVLELLNRFPRRLVAFWMNFCLEPVNYGKFKGKVVSWAVRPYFPEPSYGIVGLGLSELIKDKAISDKILEVWNGLVSLGLAVEAYDNVSTRGGELRDLCAVMAPEAVEFLRKIPAPSDLKNEIKSYAIFSVLKRYRTSERMRRDEFLGIIAQHGQQEADVKALVDKMSMAGLTSRYTYSRVAPFLILDANKFDRFLDETFVEPLRASILGLELAPVPPSPILEAKAEKEEKKRIETIETVPEVVSDLSILLGFGVESSQPNYWSPLKEKNPHALVVGTTGSGKTETLKALVHELKFRKIPSLILDFHDEYSDVAEGMNVRGGVTINPLELLERSPKDTTYEVSSILRAIYSLGDQQEAELRKAIKKSYEDAGIGLEDKDKQSWSSPPPAFQEIKTALEKAKEEADSRTSQVIATLLNRLEPIFDIGVFSGETRIDFESVVQKSVALQMKDLPTEELKTATSDFFLRKLWNYVYKIGRLKDLRLYCVIDEGHRLAYKESPLDHLLREARKYGVGVILSSQKPSDFTENVMANVGTMIALQCPLESDARFMAKQLNCEPHEVQFIEKRGEAIVKFSTSKDSSKIRIKPYLERVGATSR